MDFDPTGAIVKRVNSISDIDGPLVEIKRSIGNKAEIRDQHVGLSMIRNWISIVITHKKTLYGGMSNWQVGISS